MIRVIDIETTGFDPAADEIIEIASVDLARSESGQFGIANPMQTFLNPGRPIPPAVSGVHHIVDEDVAGAPLLATAPRRRPMQATRAPGRNRREGFGHE